MDREAVLPSSRHHIWIAALSVALALGAGALLLWRPWAAPGSADGDAERDAETAAVAAGRALADACTVCHALDRGSAPRVGPHLWRIVGRPVGGIDGFGYSRALVEAGGVWTVERLDRFLADPGGSIPGTAMVYAGLPSAADRSHLIAFLATLAD